MKKNMKETVDLTPPRLSFPRAYVPNVGNDIALSDFSTVIILTMTLLTFSRAKSIVVSEHYCISASQGGCRDSHLDAR